MNRGHYIDDASGIEELEKRTAPKARIVETTPLGLDLSAGTTEAFGSPLTPRSPCFRSKSCNSIPQKFRN